MAAKVQLLAHAGAPSSRADDDRYKGQAQAYLGFVGTRLSSPGTVDAGARNLRHGAITDVQAETQFGNEISIEVGRNDPAMELPDETTFLEDTQSAFAAIESQLVTSSLPGSSRMTPLKRIDGGAERLASSPWSSMDQGTPVLQTRHRLPRQPALFRPSVKRASTALEVEHQHPDFVSQHTQQQRISEDHGPSQSSYLKSPLLDRSAKKPRLGHDFGQPVQNVRQLVSSFVAIREGSQIALDSIGDHAPRLPDDAARDSSIEMSPDQDGMQQPSAGDEVTSELPTTYSLSDITSDSSRVKHNSMQRSASDPGPAMSHDSLRSRNEPVEQVVRQRTVPDEGASFRINTNLFNAAAYDVRSKLPAAILDPQVKHLHRVLHLPTPTNERSAQKLHPLVESNGKAPGQPDATLGKIPATSENPTEVSAAAPAVKSTDKPRSMPEEGPLLAQLLALPAAIRPPPPEVSVAGFTTHVKEHLDFLAKHPDLLQRYKPVSVTRELRALERGYWLMNTAGWPLQSQLEFWQFMQEFLGQGKAGWGVWCARENDVSATTGRESSLAARKAQTSLGLVKVFCWGEVVKHIYLLLYTASKSKVRRTGLKWIDAEEQVVVRMLGG